MVTSFSSWQYSSFLICLGSFVAFFCSSFSLPFASAQFFFIRFPAFSLISFSLILFITDIYLYILEGARFRPRNRDPMPSLPFERVNTLLLRGLKALLLSSSPPLLCGVCLRWVEGFYINFFQFFFCFFIFCFLFCCLRWFSGRDRQLKVAFRIKKIKESKNNDRRRRPTAVLFRITIDFNQ